MNLAERICFDTMLQLGYRWPTEHSQWREVVNNTQSLIDDEILAMERIALQNAQETRRAMWRMFLVTIAVVSALGSVAVMRM